MSEREVQFHRRTNRDERLDERNGVRAAAARNDDPLAAPDDSVTFDALLY
jgi:hypothetical protein